MIETLGCAVIYSGDKAGVDVTCDLTTTPAERRTKELGDGSHGYFVHAAIPFSSLYGDGTMLHALLQACPNDSIQTFWWDLEDLITKVFEAGREFEKKNLL